MSGIPPLNLSSGPSMSESGVTGGRISTGPFDFKSRKSSFWQQLAPLVLVGGVVWLMSRK